MRIRMLFHWLIAAISAATLFAPIPDALATPTNYTVTSKDGVKLAVQESGNPDGAPIILVHGLLGSRLNWDAHVRSPELLPYRIITCDLRGHGLSDKPSGAKPYHDGGRWGDDLAAVIKGSHARKPPLLCAWRFQTRGIRGVLRHSSRKRLASTRCRPRSSTATAMA
jgi:non-heme chloroperoxidase